MQETSLYEPNKWDNLLRLFYHEQILNTIMDLNSSRGEIFGASIRSLDLLLCNLFRHRK